MPTIISHAVVPLSIATGLGRRHIASPLLLTAVAASILPDADVLFFRFGATYDSLWAHRGFTHSLGSALVLGLLAAALFRRSVTPHLAFAYVALAAASHGLLDMLTNGGHGVAVLWPVSGQRYFFTWRPIQVSPLSAARFATRAARIASTEFLWIWVPGIIVALGLRASRLHQGPIP